MHLAVLDLGATAFHLLIVRPAAGALVTIERARRAVRLGSGVLAHGRLDDAAVARGLDALGALAAQARRHPGCRLACVATSALREAEDAARFVDAAAERHGVHVEILSGRAEGELLFAAAAPGPEPTALVELGGGSALLAGGARGVARVVHALPLGVLRLREALVPGDGHVGERTGAAIAGAVRALAEPAAAELAALRPARVVLTSGTARAVWRLARELSDGARDERELRRDLLARLVLILGKFRPTNLATLGLDEDRTDTIATGAVLLLALLDLLGATRAEISERALADGVALRELARLGLSPSATLPFPS